MKKLIRIMTMGLMLVVIFSASVFAKELIPIQEVKITGLDYPDETKQLDTIVKVGDGSYSYFMELNWDKNESTGLYTVTIKTRTYYDYIYNENTRATALAIHQTALYAGIVICSCVSGLFAEIPSETICGKTIDGWQFPFILFGGIGILWAFMLIFMMRDTKPIANANGTVEKASFKDALLVVVRKPSAIMLALGFGMMIYVDCGFKTWMPTFLQEHFKMDAASAATNAVLWHYIGAFFGVMIGGRITDKLAPKRRTIRFEANIIGLLCGAPFIFFMANTPSQALCFIALLFFGLCRGIYDSNLFASLFDVVAPRYRASASGLMLCFAFIIGSTSPVVLGWIRDNFGMSYGIASLSAFYIIGGLIILCARNLFFARDCVETN